jgi:hypothetical protein
MPERAALITALVSGCPLCLGCCAAKANMSAAAVMAYLEDLARMVVLQQAASGTCRVCGRVGRTCSIPRGTSSPS